MGRIIGLTIVKFCRTYLRKKIRQHRNKKLATLDCATAAKVIRTFNEGIRDEILKGYRFKIPGVGTLRIIKQSTGSVPKPNWGISTENKKAIIERGGKPFKQWKENGEMKNNGGQKWLTYHVQEFFYMWHIWHKNFKVINNKQWQFLSIRNNRELLTERIRQDELNTIMFD